MGFKGHKGKYIVKNKEKYVGDVNNITYRSSWEKKVMIELDHNPNVYKWTSEETVIPYRSPIDNRMHRYYVDFTVWYKNAKGEILTTLIEVKPFKETLEPKKTKGKKKENFIREMQTYLVNQAKWQTAVSICESKKNHKFIVMTEKDIYGK